MASQIDTALNSLADSIRTIPEMANAKIVVDWQQDLETIAKKAIAKQGGFACFIGLSSATNDSPKVHPPRVRITFEIELVYKPIVSDPANEKSGSITEAVMRHVHGLSVDSIISHRDYQFVWENLTIIPLPTFLTHTLTFSTIQQLTNP